MKKHVENHHLGVVYPYKKGETVQGCYLLRQQNKLTDLKTFNISAAIPTKKDFPDDNQKQKQNPSIKSGPSTLHERLINMHLKIDHMENPTQVKETTSPFRDVAAMCPKKNGCSIGLEYLPTLIS